MIANHKAQGWNPWAFGKKRESRPPVAPLPNPLPGGEGVRNSGTGANGGAGVSPVLEQQQWHGRLARALFVYLYLDDQRPGRGRPGSGTAGSGSALRRTAGSRGGESRGRRRRCFSGTRRPSPANMTLQRSSMPRRTTHFGVRSNKGGPYSPILFPCSPISRAKMRRRVWRCGKPRVYWRSIVCARSAGHCVVRPVLSARGAG